MAEIDPNEKMHTVADVAGWAGVSKSLIHREIYSGHLRSVRLFSKVLIPDSAWREFLAAHLKPNDGPRKRHPAAGK